MVAVERSWEPTVGLARQRALYSGEIWPLYKIFIVKLLLAIPTLGFYNFWAAAKERRYHLANLALDGDPFEWTGTGGELAIGFLKAAAFLLLLAVPGIVLTFLGNPLGSALAQGLPLVAIFLLGPAAAYWGLRYRLSRTRWRGIRGGMVGSGLAYALRAHGWSLVMPFTLFQAVPFRSIDLARYRISRMRFGTAPFEFSGSVRAVFGAWLAAWLLLAGMLLGLVALAPAVVTGLEGAGMIAAVGLGIVGLILLETLGGLLLLVYAIVVYRHTLNSTSVAGISFGTEATVLGIIGMMLLQILLVGATFGLARPVATHLNWRYFAQRLTVTGELDAAIRQSKLKGPGSGEGLLEAGDIGVL
ncbi:MAG TPA: DUF898 family protein [Methylomirabilota bacterium]|jgi:uncharacterized membrane protein YjgN (DUF898 family)|nr:DUF898 family protein [Methylomirabilota bacterium]